MPPQWIVQHCLFDRSVYLWICLKGIFVAKIDVLLVGDVNICVLLADKAKCHTDLQWMLASIIQGLWILRLMWCFSCGRKMERQILIYDLFRKGKAQLLCVCVFSSISTWQQTYLELFVHLPQISWASVFERQPNMALACWRLNPSGCQINLEVEPPSGGPAQLPG